mgnify:CR=1 FL=1
MLYNKKSLISFSVIMLFLCSSCMDSTTTSSQDLTPLIEKQELFEKKLNQIVKKIDALQETTNAIQEDLTKVHNKVNTINH